MEQRAASTVDVFVSSSLSSLSATYGMLESRRKSYLSTSERDGALAGDDPGGFGD